MIDTHAHIQFPQFRKDVKKIINQAKAAGVEEIIIVGSNTSDSRDATKLAEKYSLWATVGIHPLHANEYRKADLEILEKLATHKRVIGIGEIGLDYHHKRNWQTQRKLFIDQLSLAKQLKLPIVIHNREAFEDVYRILKTAKIENKLLLHSFTGTPRQAKIFLDLGCMISFSGIVTFPNTDALQETAKTIPEKKILIETDCPYLAPQPVRGQRNEPAYIRYTLKKLAELRHMPLDKLEETIDRNTRQFFGI